MATTAVRTNHAAGRSRRLMDCGGDCYDGAHSTDWPAAEETPAPARLEVSQYAADHALIADRFGIASTDARRQCCQISDRVDAQRVDALALALHGVEACLTCGPVGERDGVRRLVCLAAAGFSHRVQPSFADRSVSQAEDGCGRGIPVHCPGSCDTAVFPSSNHSPGLRWPQPGPLPARCVNLGLTMKTNFQRLGVTAW